MVSKAAVVGIDIGTDSSCVAFVGKGNVDMVQNEVSKRSTPSLVGFTSRERLLGDSALAQIRSNVKNTCRGFKHLHGQRIDAPLVEREKFWATGSLAAAPDGFSGYDVNFKGEQKIFSSSQVTAMFLTKLRSITESWTESKVADAVISVPSYYSDVHRQSVLDAAQIAGMPVLSLMNEHTATALAYGIYRSNDFDPEKPCNTAFCSMGHSTFSVSVVQFVKGKLEIVCECSDKVGGRDMNECLIRAFAEQFNKKHGCDPLSSKKATSKLEDAVEKTKKVLSANNEAPVNVECLMEDEDFASLMKREDFERMCTPMMDRVKKVLESARKEFSAEAKSKEFADNIDFVEVVGGASRVPWLKSMIQEVFDTKELSFTLNADESVARGCALQGAIQSPLYKVRDFKVYDKTPHGINVCWVGSSADTEAVKTEDATSTDMAGAEGEVKMARIFESGAHLGSVKALTFHRKGPFDITVRYADDAKLVPGTSRELGKYRVELPPAQEAKRVRVKAKLSTSGIFTVESAQLFEEEEYDEKTKEKRELPPDDKPEEPEQPAPAEGAEAKEGEAEGDKKKEPPKEPEKKYEWVDVVKRKKRTKTTDLQVTKTGTPGLSSHQLLTWTDEETKMQAEMREVVETDERRNDFESYILNTRDKIATGGVWAAFVSDADRADFTSDLQKAEDWLYDNFDGTKIQYIDKLTELRQFGDPIAWRVNEDEMRPQWIQAVRGTVANYRAAAENPGEKYGHIAPEKLASVITKCEELKSWIDAMEQKQQGMSKTIKPVLLCADMEKKNQELAKFADEILKEPKPAPPKEEKKDGEAASGEEKKDGETAGEDNQAHDKKPDVGDID